MTPTPDLLKMPFPPPPKIAAKRHCYEVFPFVLFFRIMENEDLLKIHGVSEEDWEQIKKTWIMNHEEGEKDPYFNSSRDELTTRSRYNKLIALRARAELSSEGLEEIYKSIKLKFHPDKLERVKYLDHQIQKAKNTNNIYEKLKSQLGTEKLKDLENRAQGEYFGVTQAYECIASLELAGASVPDYEKMTLGKYDALSASLKKKNERNGGKG